MKTYIAEDNVRSVEEPSEEGAYDSFTKNFDMPPSRIIEKTFDPKGEPKYRILWENDEDDEEE